MTDDLLLQLEDMLTKIRENWAKFAVFNFQDFHSVFQLRNAFCN